MNVKVLIVDDTILYRKIIKDILDTIPNIEVVGSVSHGQQALTRIQTLKPDLLTLDVEMPIMNGIQVLEALKEKNMDVACLMVSSKTQKGSEATIRALELGAFDFIEKPFNDQLLLDLVNKAILHNQTSKETQNQQLELHACRDSLTPREQEIMDLITQGEANKSIAHQLGISDKTVEAHRAKVMSKMQANTLAELVRMALELNRS